LSANKKLTFRCLRIARQLAIHRRLCGSDLETL